jgi:hypothetical protein
VRLQTGPRAALIALGLLVAAGVALALALGGGDRGGTTTTANRPPAATATPGITASLFVSPSGDDGAPCTQAHPCRSFDRAYHAARPGQVVELAGGRYPHQTITPDHAKVGRGCESAGRRAACVVLRPAAGATVDVRELDVGGDYSKPGPAGIAIDAGRGRLRTGSTDLNQAREVVVSGVEHRMLYMTGGADVTIRGGSVGGLVTDDGTHPEIQRVYGSDPLVVPERITIEGVLFHDINTTSPTAHVDCLQIENGVDLVLRANRFVRCGSVGLRMSYGADGNDAPPRRVLIEGNVFGPCARTPVSECYYAAQPGVGIDVVVRGNSAAQAFQQAGGAKYAQGVRYEANVAPGVACEDGVVYDRNVWTQTPCSASDRRVSSLPATTPAGVPADPGAPADPRAAAR